MINVPVEIIHPRVERSAKCVAARPNSQRGFSLIELMVGLTISLIGTFAMMQAFALFEGQKRTTTSGNDAQQSGSYSLYEMERQIRTGGSAIIQGKSFTYNIWGCTMAGPALAAVLPTPFNGVVALPVRAFPALIYSGGVDGLGKALPDTIAVVSGNPAVRTFGAPISSTSAGTALVMSDTAFGIYPNEYLLGSNGSGACQLGQAAAVVDDASRSVTLTGTSSATFSAQTYLFDLGREPVLSLFGIDTTQNTLVAFDLLQRNGAGITEMADGIVLMKALYGVDTTVPADGVIDSWVGATAGWSAATLADGSASSALALAQVRAIRIAVVARNQLPERSSDYAVYASAAPLELFSDVADATLHYAVATEPQFRYKVYTTTIPLHNAAIKKIL